MHIQTGTCSDSAVVARDVQFMVKVYMILAKETGKNIRKEGDKENRGGEKTRETEEIEQRLGRRYTSSQYGEIHSSLKWPPPVNVANIGRLGQCSKS